MSIKTLVVAAAIAAGTFGIADRADAQWRRYAGYSSPTYTYSYPTYAYSPGVVYSSSPDVVYSSGYTYPTYYNSGVVPAGYSTPYPYTTSYYSDPYTTGYYNSYYGGYSNVYGNPYGMSVGTRGGMIAGRRAWRW